MKKYDEKFIVINKKHLANVPNDLSIEFLNALNKIAAYLPNHKYLVCNQDESYAEQVKQIILGNGGTNEINPE